MRIIHLVSIPWETVPALGVICALDFHLRLQAPFSPDSLSYIANEFPANLLVHISSSILKHAACLDSGRCICSW